MKSLQRRFRIIELKNPDWSTYVIFSKAIEGQEFNVQAISRWFSVLVDKDDYAKSEKKVIIRNLEKLSKKPEDDKK